MKTISSNITKGSHYITSDDSKTTDVLSSDSYLNDRKIVEDIFPESIPFAFEDFGLVNSSPNQTSRNTQSLTSSKTSESLVASSVIGGGQDYLQDKSNFDLASDNISRGFDLRGSFGWIGSELPTSQNSPNQLSCGCPACSASSDSLNAYGSQIQKEAFTGGGLAPQATASANYTNGIDALFYPGTPYWTNRTITYSFMTRVPNYYAGNAEERNNFVPLNSTQVNAARRALQLYSEVSGLNFVEVSDAGAGGTIQFGTAHMRAGSAHAYSPSSNPIGGDVWLNNSHSSNYTQTNGSFGFATLIHEIGHALGLKHPGNYNAGGGGSPGPYLHPSLDNLQYTVMSYNNHPGSFANPQTPMLYDIAAIQYLYGANTSTRTGNNTYAWHSSQAFMQTIWDAGGNDTISAANQFLSTTINLNPGGFSSIGPYSNGSGSRATNNLAIAFGVTIENAIGSSSNDTIYGNGATNILQGGNGSDYLAGGGGHDTLIGGAGSDLLVGYGSGTEYDVLAGGSGIDTFVLGNSSSAFYQGNDYARITDFNWRDDYIQVKGVSSQYSLQSGNWFGGSALDTAIYFGNDAIGVVQDSTNLNLANFVFA